MGVEHKGTSQCGEGMSSRQAGDRSVKPTVRPAIARTKAAQAEGSFPLANCLSRDTIPGMTPPGRRRRFRTSSQLGPEFDQDLTPPIQHWYRDNTVYFITAR